jgi:hypothetical protein
VAPSRASPHQPSSVVVDDHCQVPVVGGVCPARWRADGTYRTVGPCSGQFARRASASRNTSIVPVSRPRQRLRSSPRSYHGARAPHRLHRPRDARRGRTCKITTSSSSWNSTSSRTASSTHSRAPEAGVSHAYSALQFLTLDKPETRATAACGRSGRSTTHGSVTRVPFAHGNRRCPSWCASPGSNISPRLHARSTRATARPQAGTFALVKRLLERFASLMDDVIELFPGGCDCASQHGAGGHHVLYRKAKSQSNSYL